MFHEVSKGFLFYLHAIGGALAGYVASTSQSPSTDLPSVVPAAAMVFGAVIGTTLWLAHKDTKDER